MPVLETGPPRRAAAGYHQWIRDARLGIQNLLVHGLRTFLTMLGMIFGVAAVVAMLSIGAGAKQRVMAFIEQMGVRNVIVEAKQTLNWQAHQKIRRISPGLTLRDFRILNDDLPEIASATPRKRMTPSILIPKSQQGMPVVFGVDPSYQGIAGLHIRRGRFFDHEEEVRGTPVCVLGMAARWNLFGAADPLGRFVKVNQQWFRVIGVAGPQLTTQSHVAGSSVTDVNNIIYVPLDAALFRLQDNYSSVRDQIDGIYLHMSPGADIFQAAEVVRAVLHATHHGANDYSVVVPAQLLAEQKRTEQLFNAVMVAIASVSLIVGGIGIMNIMLASILERTSEIGLRRALGARRSDIIRQFVVEASMISIAGGTLGVVLGFIVSKLIAWLAGWSTIVTPTSVMLGFVVSISVGLIFGIYPARKAAQLDPVEAIRYE